MEPRPAGVRISCPAPRFAFNLLRFVAKGKGLWGWGPLLATQSAAIVRPVPRPLWLCRLYILWNGRVQIEAGPNLFLERLLSLFRLAL